jgi:hypothetical protein
VHACVLQVEFTGRQEQQQGRFERAPPAAAARSNYRHTGQDDRFSGDNRQLAGYDRYDEDHSNLLCLESGISSCSLGGKGNSAQVGYVAALAGQLGCNWLSTGSKPCFSQPHEPFSMYTMDHQPCTAGVRCLLRILCYLVEYAAIQPF